MVCVKKKKVMQPRLLVKLSDLSQSDVALAGGKASSLGELTNAGIEVPPGFVVTTEAYRLFSQSELPQQLQQKILAEYDNLGAERVSVRSSAVAEDSSSSSWAGQFESYLNVTKDDLVKRINDCWQSVENAQAYAEQQSGKSDMTMAVIVQKMVDSDVSGVAFSKNPITKSDKEVMIEATYGLGELLVQGMVTPDNYLVDKNTLEILDKKIQSKKVMLVYKDGSNKEQPVQDDVANKPCLDDSNIVELSRLTIDIEIHYNAPQDIEWALENDKFFILQSRPITTI